VTQLLDRPIADGSTLHQRTLPATSGSQAAGNFYRRGIEAPVRQIEITILERDGSQRRAWLASYMEDQLNSLLRLRPGWDGHRALPLTDEAVGSAITVLFALTNDLSLPPQVFPLPDGGLQMEWHAGQSVEVEIDGAGEAHALIADEAGALVMNEELLPQDDVRFSQVRQAIEQLSIRLAHAR
jgi:hypothetical protein